MPKQAHIPKTLKAIALLATLAVAGCATAAKPGNMAVMDPGVVSIASTAPGYESVGISSVSGGEETNPMWTSEVSASDFETALRYSLARRGYYNSSGDAPYQLDAQLENLRQPMIGFNMTVTSTVSYALEDRDGTVLDEHRITAPYTAQLGDHLYGVERLRLANEGAIRTNIQLYLEHLRGVLAQME